ELLRGRDEGLGAYSTTETARGNARLRLLPTHTHSSLIGKRLSRPRRGCRLIRWSRGRNAMASLYDQIQEAVRTIRAKWQGQPRAGIILGTGLGGLVEEIDAEASFPYGDIPHFPVSTAPGHAGRLVCGKLAGKSVVAMEGRFHY